MVVLFVWGGLLVLVLNQKNNSFEKELSDEKQLSDEVALVHFFVLVKKFKINSFS